MLITLRDQKVGLSIFDRLVRAKNSCELCLLLLENCSPV